MSEFVLSEYFWIAILILSWFGFLIWYSYKKTKERTFIQAYRELTKKSSKHSVSELEAIGEFKKSDFNKERGFYEFTFKNNFTNFILYSIYPMEQYLQAHLISRKYLVVYELNALVFERELKKPYRKDLGLSIQAYIYKGFTACFNISPSGLLLSVLICGMFFNYLYPTILNSFWYGAVVGLFISLINFFLIRSESVQNKLLKKKSIEVKTETFISPLESPFEILDVYQVHGTRKIDKTTSEGSKQKKEMVLRDSKEVKFLTVKGYDELYDLKRNALVKITKVETVGMEERKRTNQEMLNLRRSYYARNRAWAEELFRLKSVIQRLQRVNRDLQEEKAFVVENKDRELREMMSSYVTESMRQKNTLRDIFEEIYGSKTISEDWKGTLKNTLQRIEEGKMAGMVDKIQALIVLIQTYIVKAGARTGFSDEEISQFLSIKKVEEE